MICEDIRDLAAYGLHTGLIEADDVIYTINRLLELFQLDELSCPQPHSEITDLQAILQNMLDYACEKGLMENSIVYRDLFDTKIMGCLTPRPSEVIRKFRELYQNSPKQATDFYYRFSQDTDYIRRYRIAKDIKWITDTEYGKLDLTINLSKPEKDPKAIAAAKNAKQSGYPKCQLCIENEGYAGRVDHPARQNHRTIPITIGGERWGFQYSPYVYYNEHCIAFRDNHVPMVINRTTFSKLFDFIDYFPHYFIGSNADLPIVGGSILTHEHFQGGCYQFAMERAGIEKKVVFKQYEDVEAGLVKWPMSVIRLRHQDRERLESLADKILLSWKCYSDPDAFIFAETEGEPHNTITPIARKNNGCYELDLVLRNNITTKEHPLGVFHPHAELHHIKKENIGLIEVMGLAVLPARLKDELTLLGDALVSHEDIRANEIISKHADWADGIISRWPGICRDNVIRILQEEVGQVFAKVLEHAGVYKRTPEGQVAFQRFLSAVNQ